MIHKLTIFSFKIGQDLLKIIKITTFVPYVE